MKVLVDTRQQKDKHKNIDDYFEANGIETDKSIALKVGDYMLENGKIAVDTKQDLYELASDLFSKKEIARFQRECKRAKELGLKLYILTEQPMTKEKLLKWKSKKDVNGKLLTKATGKAIYNKMQIYSLMFGVYWRFCRKDKTGKEIIKLLGEDSD